MNLLGSTNWGKKNLITNPTRHFYSPQVQDSRSSVMQLNNPEDSHIHTYFTMSIMIVDSGLIFKSAGWLYGYMQIVVYSKPILCDGN